jgi:hypothetical protein
VLRLLCKEAGNSITPFEETAPAGTETTFHLHRNCDEVAHVLSGEITFEIGDRSAGRAPVPSCRVARHMLGKTPAPKQAVCCLYIRQPRLAAFSRNSWGDRWDRPMKPKLTNCGAGTEIVGPQPF